MFVSLWRLIAHCPRGLFRTSSAGDVIPPRRSIKSGRERRNNLCHGLSLRRREFAMITVAVLRNIFTPATEFV